MVRQIFFEGGGGEEGGGNKKIIMVFSKLANGRLSIRRFWAKRGKNPKISSPLAPQEGLILRIGEWLPCHLAANQE